MAENFRIVPAILLTGFLGAGKTTLLNRLIDHYQDRKLAVLVNEFGDMGIDAELIPKGDFTTIELNKGSLFCICVRTDFIDAVARVATEIQPDLLLIEATGLADTTDMEKMLALPNISPFLELKAVVCLVDACNFLKINSIFNAPASQVRDADLLLINKADQVSDKTLSELKQFLSEMTAAEIMTTHFARFDLSMLDKMDRVSPDPSGAPGEGRPDPLESVSVEFQGDLDPSDVEQFLDHRDSRIIRMKGFLNIKGQSHYLDVTVDRHSLSRTPHQKKVNRLVFIGKRLDKENISWQVRQLLNVDRNFAIKAR
ncbi:hypothetical protein GF406_05975 [candidate division KSB1 bacterium]|nr:hypothetical protein [candidate division KSB1 bacterium]